MTDRRVEPVTSGTSEDRYAALANVSQLVKVAAVRDGDAVALVQPGRDRRTLTWAELDAAADRFARALSARGLVAGQRVALAMGNSVELAIAYFGIVRGGMIAVPVDSTIGSDEAALTLAASTPRLVVSDDESAGRIKAAASKHRSPIGIVTVGAAAEAGAVALADFLAEAGDTEPVAPADAELTAMLAFSTGTAGEPRLAMLSHRALLANVEQMVALEFSPIEPGDTVTTTRPLANVYGLNAILTVAARQLATTVVSAASDAGELLTVIESEAVTVLATDAELLQALSDAPPVRSQLSGVRLVRAASVVLSDDVCRAFAAATGHVVERGYGLPECGPAVCATLASECDSSAQPPKPGSAGRPLPGVELRVVDPAGSTAAPGDPGEIVIRGANLFSGYWPHGSGGPDDLGWYRTGHVGVLDSDGDLAIVERSDEVLTVSGFSVFPSEVEDVIADVAGVRSVAVVGHSDAETHQSVVAYIVRDDVSPGQAHSDAALAEAVEAECRAKLARFKCPSRVVIVDEMPLNQAGTIDSDTLKQQADWNCGSSGRDE